MLLHECIGQELHKVLLAPLDLVVFQRCMAGRCEQPLLLHALSQHAESLAEDRCHHGGTSLQ